MVGIGRGAGRGVLIKNAEALERMERVDTIVVDKTGTLTEGRPSVTAIVAMAGFSEDDILGLAAGVERASEHPLALAIVAARSEEHTSELQSLMRISYAVFCLKKKNKAIHNPNAHNQILKNKTTLQQDTTRHNA